MFTSRSADPGRQPIRDPPIYIYIFCRKVAHIFLSPSNAAANAERAKRRWLGTGMFWPSGKRCHLLQGWERALGTNLRASQLNCLTMMQMPSRSALLQRFTGHLWNLVEIGIGQFLVTSIYHERFWEPLLRY